VAKNNHPIGIFDSGYGGLTVFRWITAFLPQYDYLYLGDNARAPYGNRSFDTVYEYTLQSVEWFFKQGCPLVILACNTASAKALRTIQQNDLAQRYPDKRVLGVIRPTAEVIAGYSRSGKIGILGTIGTINSQSYCIEINHFSPSTTVYQQACPMWVPFIENGSHIGNEMDYFIESDLKALFEQNAEIDTILLGCTHYPLIIDKIRQYVPPHVTIVSQGNIVASSLVDYLLRHPDMASRLTKNGMTEFCTTDDPVNFATQGRMFLDEEIEAKHVRL